MSVRRENSCRVALYLRSSKKDGIRFQAEIEEQKQSILNYIKEAKELHMVTKEEWIFTDRSAGDPFQRKGFKQLIKAIQAQEFDKLIVWDIGVLSFTMEYLMKVLVFLAQSHIDFSWVRNSTYFKDHLDMDLFSYIQKTIAEDPHFYDDIFHSNGDF